MRPSTAARRSRARSRLAFLAMAALVLAGCQSGPTPSKPPTTTTQPVASPGASAAASGDPTVPGASLSLPPATKAVWNDCGKGFQCATIRVPRDYHDLTQGSLDLSLIRLPASDRKHRIGSLVVNPGGPGGSGVDLVRDSYTAFSTELRKRFDLVGFDPRGVNSSSAVRCIENLDPQADLDPSPDNAEELDALVSDAHTYADACAQRNEHLLPYLSTDAVVDDLDRIRASLGDDKLTYFGFSYGTLIGSMYADKYPDHIRALVLDGALDPSVSELGIRRGQAIAFEAELKRFFSWCSSHRSCAFYEGGHTERAYNQLMAKIEKKPLRIRRFAGRRRVGPGLAFSATLGAMYNRSSWPSLALALHWAKKGDGRLIVAISDPFRGRKPDGAYSNMSDAYFSNTCLDFPVSTLAAYRALDQELRRVAPHFRAAAYNDLPCLYWPVPPERKPAPASGAGAPPIVVVGSTRDPATPYAWSKALASQLQSGVLITRKGDGHTAYAVSSCIAKSVDAYLLELTVPKDGLVCQK
jgi:pimeloyl-ACP methyl ester carboxylesterase